MSDVMITLIRLWGQSESHSLIETRNKIASTLVEYDNEEMYDVLKKWEIEYNDLVEKESKDIDICDFFERKVNELVL